MLRFLLALFRGLMRHAFAPADRQDPGRSITIFLSPFQRTGAPSMSAPTAQTDDLAGAAGQRYRQVAPAEVQAEDMGPGNGIEELTDMSFAPPRMPLPPVQLDRTRSHIHGPGRSRLVHLVSTASDPQ